MPVRTWRWTSRTTQKRRALAGAAALFAQADQNWGGSMGRPARPQSIKAQKVGNMAASG
jgi:hypothetical protein